MVMLFNRVFVLMMATLMMVLVMVMVMVRVLNLSNYIDDEDEYT